MKNGRQAYFEIERTLNKQKVFEPDKKNFDGFKKVFLKYFLWFLVVMVSLKTLLIFL